jgi:hypothetical protein
MMVGQLDRVIGQSNLLVFTGRARGWRDIETTTDTKTGFET